MLVEVLSRLPVKSLLRFKCVCKSWRTLIESSEFTSARLKNYHASTSLLVRWYDIKARRSFMSLVSPSMKENWPAMDLDLPKVLKGRGGAFKLLRVLHGPCNGIICLAYDNLNRLALWNPTTRECKLVPEYNTSRVDVLKGTTDLGFGFDAKTNDYKVLQFVYADQFDEAEYFELYSLRKDSWKKLEPTNNVGLRRWCRASRRSCLAHGFSCRLSYTVQGFICWLVLDEGSKIFRNIISFDINSEKFSIINLPPEFPSCSNAQYCIARLFPLRESTALIHSDSYNNNMDGLVDIWVSETFPGGAWRRMWSLCFRGTSFIIPLALCEDGRFLYKMTIDSRGDTEGFVLYDPRTRETKQFGLGSRRLRCGGLVFQEGLVAISSLHLQKT